MQLPLRIIIADDHLIFRQGVKALLAHEPEVTVVAETGRASKVAAVLAQTPCDLLVLDLQMERTCLADIESLVAQVPVLVLTASEVASDAFAALRMGVRAVVFKRFGVETLMEAIRTVAAGNVWMPASLQTEMAARLRSPVMNTLSPREEEVIRCVGLGLRNAEVAQQLSITEQTVKTHLNNIFRKLGLRDRVKLALYATRAGVGSSTQRG